MKKEEHNITLIAEFSGTNTDLMVRLSEYLSFIVNGKDDIVLDIQSFPKGYRLTCRITYKCFTLFKFARKRYLKELANLGDWVFDDKSIDSLYKYHYTYT